MTKQLLTFLDEGKSPYHVIANLEREMEQKGFVLLKEQEFWKLEAGKGYFVNRGGSSLIAFTIPEKEPKGYRISASHSDSPTFKIKNNPEIIVEGQYIKLNTEKYGGSIHASWMDRPLSVAGRIVVKQNEGIQSVSVSVDRDLLVIPNVAIHMNPDINKGMEYNAQTDMLPLYAMGGESGQFQEQIAAAAGVKAEDILGQDLFLYVRQKAVCFGASEEFIVSPRLDDLQCVFACKRAFLQADSKKTEYVNVCAVFDNEEVGSTTRQGADSTFLEDVLYRIAKGLSMKREQYLMMLADSFLISADNAHGVHPNHPEKSDATNRPYLNGGVVIKYHGGQKYTTDGWSGAVVKELCKKAGVPFQTFANRSDMVGGSTLGNIAATHVSIPAADIGLSQLAMHSAVETAGRKDTEYAVKLLKLFYEGRTEK